MCIYLLQDFQGALYNIIYKCWATNIQIVILLIFRDWLESFLQHFNVMDRLEDNLQLWQVPLCSLHVVRQQRPQPLHVAGADVGGVQLNILDSDDVHHDDTWWCWLVGVALCTDSPVSDDLVFIFLRPGWPERRRPHPHWLVTGPRPRLCHEQWSPTSGAAGRVWRQGCLDSAPDKRPALHSADTALLQCYAAAVGDRKEHTALCNWNAKFRPNVVFSVLWYLY